MVDWPAPNVFFFGNLWVILWQIKPVLHDLQKKLNFKRTEQKLPYTIFFTFDFLKSHAQPIVHCRNKVWNRLNTIKSMQWWWQTVMKLPTQSDNLWPEVAADCDHNLLICWNLGTKSPSSFRTNSFRSFSLYFLKIGGSRDLKGSKTPSTFLLHLIWILNR